MKAFNLNGKLVLVLCLLVLLGGAAVPAGVIFDTGIGNSTTFRDADSGPGQGITVGTDTTITQIGFYAATPAGANVKFMIWDGTNSTLLFSQTDALGASATPALILSDPFSFNLTAGNTYYFGIIGNNEIDVSFIFPPVSLTQNGLTAVMSGNSNYSGFDDPALSGGGAAMIALQLVGDAGGGAVPEPGTTALLGLGFVGMLGAAWRRKSAGARAR